MHGCRWCGDDGVSASNVQYYIPMVWNTCNLWHMRYAAVKVRPTPQYMDEDGVVMMVCEPLMCSTIYL